VIHLSSIVHDICAFITQYHFHINIKAKSKPTSTGEIKIQKQKRRFNKKSHPKVAFKTLTSD